MSDVTVWSLWLPIVVSGVAVFVASFLAWMVLPHHRSDWSRLPDEIGFTESIRSQSIPADQYMFPHAASSDDWKSEEFKQRWKEGPTGTLTIMGGTANMGLNMLWTFLFYLVTAFFVAYIASIAFTRGAGFLDVFQITGATAILGHCFGGIPNAIWFHRKLRAVINDTLDGIVYGIITGLIFAWLWPAASEAAL